MRSLLDSPSLVADLQALLDASPDAVLIVDRSGTVIALNQRTEALFGTTADRLRGQLVEVLLPPRLRERHAAARSAYGRAPTVREMSGRPGLRGLRADGTEFPVEISLAPVVGSEAGLVMALVHEVTGPTDLDQMLEGAGHGAGALDAMLDAILTTDARGRIDFMNRTAERLTGRTRQSVVGRRPSEAFALVDQAGGERLDAAVDECLRTGVGSGACEIILPAAADRDGRTLDVSTTPIHGSSGSVTGAAVVARDVTHARLLARQLSHQATHDPLTGLVNRSEFERRLARLFVSAGDELAEHAVCFLDLDGFKRVNDTCGHLAGDELLRQLSDLMRERMRSRDTLARLGGDEFGMILEHCRLPRALRIAEQMRAAIGAYRFVVGGATYSVGVSIGVVPVRADGPHPRDVIRDADSACYRAKHAGGNRIELYDRHRRPAEAVRDHDWLRRVVSALDEGRLRLYCQALVPLDASPSPGARLELLLRLDEGGAAPLLPGAFLPAARRYALMPRIDRWVIGEAVRRLAAWERANAGRHPPAVSINLADETVISGEAGGIVREALATSGLEPDRLCFEIGESAAAGYAATSARLVRELREAGCRVTLEQCGSGMAAFTLLRRMPVDSLKIAGHVVRGMARDPVDRALATALNSVGHALGLATIGVEVETDEALDALRGIGVDYAQGYAIGRPEPLDDVLARLAEPSRSAGRRRATAS